MIELRTFLWLFNTDRPALSTLTARTPQAEFAASAGETNHFTVMVTVDLKPFTWEKKILDIPNVLGVRLRPHDPADRNRQNYPAFKMPDGSVPVLEATVLLHSREHPDWTNATLDDYAGDVVALLDALGAARAAVCGCSMGGYAAFAILRRHPDRVRALVLADTRAAADTPEARRNRSLQLDKVRQEGAGAIADAMLPRRLGATTRAERLEVLARVRDTILGTSPRGIVDGLAGLAARADPTSTLREVRVPTLVLCGQEDELTPPAESEAMARDVAGATLVLVPRAGHLANLENPEPFTTNALYLRLPQEDRRVFHGFAGNAAMIRCSWS